MFQKTVIKLLKKNPNNSLLPLLEKCKHINHFKQIHASLLKSRIPDSITNLFSVAAVSGDPQLFTHSCKIFQHLPNRNTFIYNNMIRGYVQSHLPMPAILCYLDMLNYGLIANNYTFPPLIKAYTLLVPSMKLIGRMVHTHIVVFGFCDDPFVVSALIEHYSSVIEMGIARRLFDGVGKKDVVLWTAMIDGYGKMGDVVKGRELFDVMPDRNVISWSAMMAGYSRVNDFEEVLGLFTRMQEEGIVPNESVLGSVLTACGHLGALTQGLWVHSYAKRNNQDRENPVLATAIVDMYAKCGRIEAALLVFGGIQNKDAGAWNAIISGVAMNGDANTSLGIFAKMCGKNGAQPNETTFVSILSACIHAGLVYEGLKLFNQMGVVYKVEPQREHYACVVDLLARAGMLEEAEKFIEEKIGGFGGIDANVWGALLGACRVHQNVEVGNRVWKKLTDFGLGDYGTHVLMYNIYKEAGWEMEAKRVRLSLTKLGLKKKPGCSLIEVNGVVDEFVAGDHSHTRAGEICEILGSLF